MSENIVITGFGPFGEHRTNASWEAVKKLPEDILGYKIIKEEIQVNYDCVENRVPRLWEAFNPKLVIHVGVSSLTNHIQIETCANRSNYVRKDCNGITRTNGHKVCDKDECIHSGIEVKEICQSINKDHLFHISPSSDAGRYLCEYIYYSSLSIDKDKTLFVHVPPLNKPYSADELAAALVLIIKYALMQIDPAGTPTIYKNGRAAAAIIN